MEYCEDFIDEIDMMEYLVEKLYQQSLQSSQSKHNSDQEHNDSNKPSLDLPHVTTTFIEKHH